MAGDSLTKRIKSEAHRLGFTWSGVCAAVEPTGFHHLVEWVQRGYAADMHYFSKRLEAYRHPKHVLEGVRSLVVLALPYHLKVVAESKPGFGRVATYAARTIDYHDLIHDRLNQLDQYIRQLEPEAINRGVVDTAPLLEREFAQRAGLGWIGKNTLVINKSAGSYFFLAVMLTNLELEYDAPHATQHCGTCRACLDACPTQAFPEPGVLDARRCISYLTIECRDEIPEGLRSGIGDWLFGCDVCQAVCPWNRKASEAQDAEWLGIAPQTELDLIELLILDEDAFRKRFKSTPFWRPRRRGMLRNAAIVLGNQRCIRAIPILERCLEDSEPIIREAAAWALQKIKGQKDD